MPIAGLVFLGWHATNVIVLYFIDFLVDIAMVLALLMLLDPSFKTEMQIPPGPKATAKLAASMLMVIGILCAVFGFVFGMPVFGMLMMDPDISLGKLFADERFRRGVLIHLALSSWTYVQAYRYFAALRKADAQFDVSVPLKGRFHHVLIRWLAVYVAGLTLPFFPAAMVVAFCVATAYSELFPERFANLLGPPD